MWLFAGMTAEDDHDVKLMGAAGRVLARERLPERMAGVRPTV